MRSLTDCVSDYCGSEHFLFLDPAQKEHAESLLTFWCEAVEEDDTPEGIEAAMKKVSRLDVPAEVRREFPAALQAFLTFAAGTGLVADVDEIAATVMRLSGRHAESIRDDGSVRGETVRRSLKPPGRNAPCPCGSGRKYKRCCAPIFG